MNLSNFLLKYFPTIFTDDSDFLLKIIIYKQ